MDHVNRTGLPQLADYSGFVRRHRRILATLVAGGLLAGLVLALAQPRTYSATASVSLTPVPVYVMPTTEELEPPEVSIDTDAQLLRSPEVLDAVATELDIDPAEAEEHLSVTASAGTHVLHVTVSGADREAVARAADAAAAALVDVRRDALGALTLDQIRQLRFLVLAQEARLAREQSRRVVVAPTDDLFASLLTLQTRLAEAREARKVPAEVISPAPERGRPDYANTEVWVTSGAGLGLLAGCLVGAWRDRRRRGEVAHHVPPSHHHPHDLTHDRPHDRTQGEIAHVA